MIFDDYSFIYFICEGTNEEEVLNWTIREDALNIDKENYSTDLGQIKWAVTQQILAKPTIIR